MAAVSGGAGAAAELPRGVGMRVPGGWRRGTERAPGAAARRWRCTPGTETKERAHGPSAGLPSPFISIGSFIHHMHLERNHNYHAGFLIEGVQSPLTLVFTQI